MHMNCFTRMELWGGEWKTWVLWVNFMGLQSSFTQPNISLCIQHSIDVVNVHNQLTCTEHHPQWPGWVQTSSQKALRTKLSYLGRRNSTCAQQLQFMSVFSSAHLTAYPMDPHSHTQILDSWSLIIQLPMGALTQTEGSEWLDDGEGWLYHGDHATVT